MEFIHKSVLFDESIKALNIDGSKVIADGTAGGGGHSREIAKSAKHLIAIDQDPDAIQVLNERLGNFDNVTIVHNNFVNIKQILHQLGVEKIDGNLSGYKVINISMTEEEFDAIEIGNNWLPQYDNGLLDKKVELVFGAEKIYTLCAITLLKYSSVSAFTASIFAVLTAIPSSHDTILRISAFATSVLPKIRFTSSRKVLSPPSVSSLLCFVAKTTISPITLAP